MQPIISSGLIRLLVPRRWGGHEMSWYEASQTAMEIAKACPSTGWCYSLLVLHNWMVAFWPEQAQADVWHATPDACVASSFNPAPGSSCEITPGGYRLNGKWSFSSGIDHSDWVIVSHRDPAIQSESGRHTLYFLVPKSDCTVHDVWHVVGMRGTGSNVVELTNVFVPQHRVIALEPWNEDAQAPGTLVNPSPLYKIQLSAVMPVTLLSVIIGATVGAYELWRDHIANSRSRNGGIVASSTSQQVRLTRVAKKIEAAKALLEHSLQIVHRGETLDYKTRVSLRCNYAYCAELCTEAVETMFMTSGAAATAERNLLQLFWRDIHAGAMHMAFNFESVGTLYAQMELGLPAEVLY